MKLTDLYIEWAKLDDNNTRQVQHLCLCDKHYEEFWAEEWRDVYHFQERDSAPDYEGQVKKCDYCE